MARVISFGSGLLCALAFSGFGCQSPEKVKLNASGAPVYEQLHIVYDVGPAAGHVRLDNAPAVTPAGHAEPDGDSRAQPSFRRMRLEIDYPHPGVHPEFARATLRFVPDGSLPDGFQETSETQAQSPKAKAALRMVSGLFGGRPNEKRSQTLRSPAGEPGGTEAGGVDEILFIDLPKIELDALLYDLANAGFFDRTRPCGAESQLEVTYNRGCARKEWSRESRLDDLIEMLARHGIPAVVEHADRSSAVN